MDPVGAHDQVRALDQLHPQLVGQEAVLVIGRVEPSRGQHHHHRVGLSPGGRNRAQGGAQRIDIGLHRRDAVGGEQLREQAHHDFPVLQLVGDPGRGAGVILQHIEAVLGGADQVDSDDMGPDLVGRAHPHHLQPVLVVAVHQLGRQHPRPHHLLRTVEIGQQPVQHLGPLAQPRLDHRPLGLLEHAGDDVEGDQPLGRLLLSIDGEGDADAAEEVLGLPPSRAEQLGRGLLQPALQARIGDPAPARRPRPLGSEAVHLVEARHAPPFNSTLPRHGDGRRPGAPGASGVRRSWAPDERSLLRKQAPPPSIRSGRS